MLVFLTLFLVILLWITENKRYRWFYILAKTGKRDIRGLICLFKVNWFLKRCGRENKTLKSLFEAFVESHPNKTAYYCDDEAWSFSKVNEFSNKIARYFVSQGFEKGDTIALLLENCPEYPSIYLGLSTYGIRTSLINTNLVKEALLYSITTTKCKAIIFGNNFALSITEISDKLEGLKLYQYFEKASEGNVLLAGAVDLKSEIEEVSGKVLEEKYRQGKPSDPVVYIFTSGTTGLPKASVITNIRCLLFAKGMQIGGQLQSSDVFYVPLPLYHIAGSMGGAGQAIVCGSSVVLRKKFSASNYFKDCVKYNATVAQYIGEMCRYVLAASENTTPVKHNVKTIIGNGMRPQIWKQFVDTFKIKNVVEVYGATEGISNLVNIDSTVGSVGFVPRYLRSIFPVILIRCNETTGEPIRTSNGLCIQCKVGEPGLAIGKINRNIPVFNFEGYTDKKATEKKVLINVFKTGDSYFNSGDILVYDEFGYFYFKDRTGDTFRWKGENVSTSEVEAVISNIVKLNDVTVYGVQVPNTEGRAGMAAIVDINKTLDIGLLGNQLKSSLPGYALPVFIRVLDSVPLTSTFKLKKTDLRNEGFNIEVTKDNTYFFDGKAGSYIPLTKELFEDINNGTIRF